jgi:purine nucleosidase
LLETAEETLQPAREHAVDLIARTVMSRPGEITLIAIGPLTNVALALRREPRLAQSLAGLVVMGGVVGGSGAPHLPRSEHNFRSDPEAAQIALSAGAPVTLVPLDITTQVRIRRRDVERIRTAGGAFHRAIADQVALYPPYIERGWAYLHDPLAVAALIEPSLVTVEPLRVAVETRDEDAAGWLQVGPPRPGAPTTANVALGVAAARAERFIVDRLAIR